MKKIDNKLDTTLNPTRIFNKILLTLVPLFKGEVPLTKTPRCAEFKWIDEGQGLPQGDEASPS
jgi:hypothetical protein